MWHYVIVDIYINHAKLATRNKLIVSCNRYDEGINIFLYENCT